MTNHRRPSSARMRAVLAGRSAQWTAERQRLMLSLFSLSLPRSLTRRRHHAAVAGLLALFLQVLVPLGQAVPAGTDAHGLPRSLVVCSANGGLRTISLPGATSPTGNTVTTGMNPVMAACSVCLAYAAGGHLAPPPSVPLPLPQDGHGETILPSALTTASGPAVPLPQPRGPPSEIV